MRTYTLEEAADVAGTTPKALARRIERGTLRSQLVDGKRRIPHAELDRAGLLPDAELTQLRKRVESLTGELAQHRQLTERAESVAAAERAAHELTRSAYVEAETKQRAAEHQAAALAEKTAELEQTLDELATAGPIRAMRLRRQLRRAAVMDPEVASAQ